MGLFEHLGDKEDFGRVRRWRTWDVDDMNGDVEPDDASDDVVGVTRFGERFAWTALHQTGRELQEQRHMGDSGAEGVLERHGGGRNVLWRVQDSGTKDDAGFLHSLEPPEWVDWDLVRQGQAVYVRWLPLCGLSLFYLSLVGGFSAQHITKVLLSTAYLTAAPEDAVRRIMDTGRMVSACCVGGTGTLRPGGLGWEACVRVRLLHARVRRRLLRSEGWRIDLWGVPINQEDMVATQLAFSVNVLAGISKLRQAPLSVSDQHAYLHLWALIGHYLGIRPTINPLLPLPHPSKATVMMAGRARLESIIMHLLEPDADSKAVAAHLLQAPAGAQGQKGHEHRESFEFRAQMCRYMVGDGLADALSLPQSSPKSAKRRDAALHRVGAYAWLVDLPGVGWLLYLLHSAALWATLAPTVSWRRGWVGTSWARAGWVFSLAWCPSPWRSWRSSGAGKGGARNQNKPGDEEGEGAGAGAEAGGRGGMLFELEFAPSCPMGFPKSHALPVVTPALPVLNDSGKSKPD